MHQQKHKACVECFVILAVWWWLKTQEFTLHTSNFWQESFLNNKITGFFGDAMFIWMLWWITWHVSWCPFLGCLEKVRNIFSQMVAKHGGKNHGFRFRKKSPTKQNPRFWDGVNLTQEVKLVKGESCDPANWSSSSTAWHHYLITRLDGHPGRW